MSIKIDPEQNYGAGACERCPNTFSHAIRRAILRLRLPVPERRASASAIAIACRRVTSAFSSRRFLCSSLRRTVLRIATACRVASVSRSVSMPSARDRHTASNSARLEQPHFANRFPTWDFTVRSVMQSSSPICLLRRPRTTNSKTVFSLALSSFNPTSAREIGTRLLFLDGDRIRLELARGVLRTMRRGEKLTVVFPPFKAAARRVFAPGSAFPTRRNS
jgi:hypothetical protein